MAGYKKNQNDNFSLPIGEFDTYSARLGDNFEEKLYTERSTTWVGVCLSGYSQNSSVADKTLMITNPIQVVDLGDGTPRYKIKVMYLSNAFGTGLISPTSISKVDLKNFNEVKLQADIDLAIDAFTEDLSVIPVFGTRVLIEEYGTTPFVRKIISESKEMYSQISKGGGSLTQFGNGMPFSTPYSGGQLPEPEQAPQFVVEGVRYVSVPATNAAARAAALYNSAKGAGMTDKSKKWETTPEGRKWVSTHIYDGLFPGKGYGAKYGPLLGVKGKESHWSSWFHNMCHKPYKKPFKGKGAYEYVEYPGKAAYDVKKQVEANPSAFIGQQIFGLFNPTDVPIFVGDSLFNFGSHGKRQVQNSYDSFKGDVSGVGAHMRVVAVKQSGKITCHGGNEGQKVGKKTFSLDGDKLHKDHHKRFAGVYKKVKVIGPA